MSGLWLIGWVLGGAVVVVAALLLIAILLTARGIEGEAQRALAALRRIDANTRAIWSLGHTAKRFNAVRDYAEGLEDQVAETAAASERREP